MVKTSLDITHDSFHWRKYSEVIYIITWSYHYWHHWALADRQEKKQNIHTPRMFPVLLVLFLLSSSCQQIYHDSLISVNIKMVLKKIMWIWYSFYIPSLLLSSSIQVYPGPGIAVHSTFYSALSIFFFSLSFQILFIFHSSSDVRDVFSSTSSQCPSQFHFPPSNV